ncbi:MAG TPA: TrkA family potassium uptake protein [Candidatus Cryosericum sp.]|jgi:trk system potassium uptake protein TrkA|nr:TrkA family potassium uptake protein [Candidatus Cryosericum sp.]
MYVVIAGGGKVGSYLARLLVGKGHDVAIIEQDPKACEALSEWGKALVINGDCCDISALIDAGMEKTDRFAAVTGDDANNLVACQLAKVRFHVPLTTARINDPRNEDVFHKIGVDFALNSTDILATVIEEGIVVHDLIPLVTLAKGKAVLVELQIPSDSPVVGKTMREVPWPRGCVVVSIMHGGDIVFPRGASELNADDTVIGLVAPDAEESFRDVLRKS